MKFSRYVLNDIYRSAYAVSTNVSGSHLLSHAVSSIVPSAAFVLTIVFGMGTGVSHKRIGTGNIVFHFVKAIGSCFATSLDLTSC